MCEVITLWIMPHVSHVHKSWKWEMTHKVMWLLWVMSHVCNIVRKRRHGLMSHVSHMNESWKWDITRKVMTHSYATHELRYTGVRGEKDFEILAVFPGSVLSLPWMMWWRKWIRTKLKLKLNWHVSSCEQSGQKDLYSDWSKLKLN